MVARIHVENLIRQFLKRKKYFDKGNLISYAFLDLKNSERNSKSWIASNKKHYSSKIIDIVPLIYVCVCMSSVNYCLGHQYYLGRIRANRKSLIEKQARERNCVIVERKKGR